MTMIEALPPEACQLCGTIAELRPYGIGGTYVCSPCAMVRPTVAEATFEATLNISVKPENYD